MRSILGALVCLFATTAGAQDWPQRPVRIVAPFAPASTPDTLASLVVVPAERDIGDLKGLLAYLRGRAGKGNYASIGVGSLSHLTMELVALTSGTQIVHVPYPGSGQAVAALLAGPRRHRRRRVDRGRGCGRHAGADRRSHPARSRRRAEGPRSRRRAAQADDGSRRQHAAGIPRPHAGRARPLDAGDPQDGDHARLACRRGKRRLRPSRGGQP